MLWDRVRQVAELWQSYGPVADRLWELSESWCQSIDRGDTPSYELGLEICSVAARLDGIIRKIAKLTLA
jgi:hypothetical protein